MPALERAEEAEDAETFETPSAQRTPRNFREDPRRSRRSRRLKSSLAASALSAPHAGSGARGGSRGRGDDLKRQARRERREIFGKTLGDRGEFGVEIVSGGLGPHRARCRLWSARGKQRVRSPF